MKKYLIALIVFVLAFSLGGVTGCQKAAEKAAEVKEKAAEKTKEAKEKAGEMKDKASESMQKAADKIGVTPKKDPEK